MWWEGAEGRRGSGGERILDAGYSMLVKRSSCCVVRIAYCEVCWRADKDILDSPRDSIGGWGVSLRINFEGLVLSWGDFLVVK